MQGHGRGCGEGLVPWRVKPRGEKRNQTPAYVNAEQSSRKVGRGADGETGGRRDGGDQWNLRHSGSAPEEREARGRARGTRVPCLAGAAAAAGRTGTPPCLQGAGLPRRPARPRLEQGLEQPGGAGAAPALAMPVMSALPARKVKGAGANHSPSVLPAGIRQRRGSGAALPAK